VAAAVLSFLWLPAAAWTSEAQAQTPQLETGQSEQVVVTATQRITPILDLPQSASVFTADRLDDAHVSQVKQLIALAPSMNVINSIGETFGQLIAVRGVATSGADLGLESAVGVTVDGVPLMRPNLAVFDFQGVDRVEFLRGPQGTLFGTNTTAGIINVLTRRPDFTPSFEASATLGERELRELRLSASGALIASKLAGRIDAVAGAVDGYLPNPNTGEVYGARRREELRGQLFLVPTDDIDVRIIADYLHHGGSVNSPVYRIVGPTGAMVDAISGVPLKASFHATDLAQIDAAAPRFETSDSAGVSAEVNWQTGPGRFTAIASYRSANARRNYDVDNSPANIANDPRDGESYGLGTLELRFQGKVDRFDYLFGAFAKRGRIVSRDSYTVGPDYEPYTNALGGGNIPALTGLPEGSNDPAGSGVFDVYRQRESGYAFFTHEVIALTDSLSLALGARYTAETKSLDAAITTNNPGCASAVALHGAALSGVPLGLQGLICIPNLDPRYDGNYTSGTGEGNWSGTASLTQRLNPLLSAYAEFSRGYKAGGFQLDRSGMSPLSPSLSELMFHQETADSIEAGLHAMSLDDRWGASAALFHTSFNNYQFSYFTGLNRHTRNVPRLVTKGVEVEGAYRPLEDLEFSVSGIYQEAIFGASGFPSDLTQLESTTAPIAPRWVLVGAASYRRSFAGLGVTGFGGFDVRWQSKANVGVSATPTPDFLQDAYAVFGARIGVESPDRNWRVEVWARNLFDQRAWSILNSTTLQPGSISGFVIDPRSTGVTATLMW
jgi:outer membrane receptor protein involved in Fe transport